MGYDCDGDYEPFDYYVESSRKARKQHKCSICRTAILPGEIYDDVRYGFEGRAGRVKRCPSCKAVYAHLVQKAEGSSVCIDFRLGCGLEYRNEWGAAPPEHIAALAFRLPGEPIPEAAE